MVRFGRKFSGGGCVDPRSDLEAIWAENSGVQVPGMLSGRRGWALRRHDPVVPWTAHAEGETG